MLDLSLFLLLELLLDALFQNDLEALGLFFDHSLHLQQNAAFCFVRFLSENEVFRLSILKQSDTLFIIKINCAIIPSVDKIFLIAL